MRSLPALSSRWPRKRLPYCRSYQKRQAAGLGSPLPELLEDHAVGEALAADPNALKNPVAAQLVQHQVGIQFASLKEEADVCGLASGPRNSRSKVGWAPRVPAGERLGVMAAHGL